MDADNGEIGAVAVRTVSSCCSGSSNSSNSCCDSPPEKMSVILGHAKRQWLKKEDVLNILKDPESFGFRVRKSVPLKSPNGTLLLCHRSVIKRFGNDGYIFNKCGSHQRLKHDGTFVLMCKYRTNKIMQRRTYHLLAGSSQYALVHYLSVVTVLDYRPRKIDSRTVQMLICLSSCNITAAVARFSSGDALLFSTKLKKIAPFTWKIGALDGKSPPNASGTRRTSQQSTVLSIRWTLLDGTRGCTPAVRMIWRGLSTPAAEPRSPAVISAPSPPPDARGTKGARS